MSDTLDVDDDLRARKPLSPWAAHKAEERRSKDMAAAQAGALLQQMTAHLGGIEAYVKAPAIADALYSGHRSIPAGNVDRISWPVAASALTVANFSRSPILIGQGEAPSDALLLGAGGAWSPPTGAGLTLVPAGVERTFAFRGGAVIVNGPAGATYGLQAFSRPRPPTSSSCGMQTTLLTAPCLSFGQTGGPGAVSCQFESSTEGLAPYVTRVSWDTLSTDLNLGTVWVRPAVGYGSILIPALGGPGERTFDPPLRGENSANVQLSGTLTAAGSILMEGFYA